MPAAPPGGAAGSCTTALAKHPWSAGSSRTSTCPPTSSTQPRSSTTSCKSNDKRCLPASPAWPCSRTSTPAKCCREYLRVVPLVSFDLPLPCFTHCVGTEKLVWTRRHLRIRRSHSGRKANRKLAADCRKAADTLNKVFNDYLQTVADRILGNDDGYSEYTRDDYLDTWGPRVRHHRKIATKSPAGCPGRRLPD